MGAFLSIRHVGTMTIEKKERDLAEPRSFLQSQLETGAHVTASEH